MSEIQRKPAAMDAGALAKLIAGVTADGGDGRLKTSDGRDLAAVLLGQRGGLRGGPARAEKLSAEERRRIAKIAAAARWSSKGDEH